MPIPNRFLRPEIFLSGKLTSNFEFIRKLGYPELANLGEWAEVNAFLSPSQSLVRLRQFGESLLNAIAERGPQEDQSALIARLKKSRSLTAVQAEVFFKLQSLGSQAAHEPNAVEVNNPETALQYLKFARDLAVVIFGDYHSKPVSRQVYKALPETKLVLVRDHNQLLADLKAAAQQICELDDKVATLTASNERLIQEAEASQTKDSLHVAENFITQEYLEELLKDPDPANWLTASVLKDRIRAGEERIKEFLANEENWKGRLAVKIDLRTWRKKHDVVVNVVHVACVDQLKTCLEKARADKSWYSKRDVARLFKLSHENARLTQIFIDLRAQFDLSGSAKLNGKPVDCKILYPHHGRGQPTFYVNAENVRQEFPAALGLDVVEANDRKLYLPQRHYAKMMGYSAERLQPIFERVRRQWDNRPGRDGYYLGKETLRAKVVAANKHSRVLCLHVGDAAKVKKILGLPDLHRKSSAEAANWLSAREVAKRIRVGQESVARKFREYAKQLARNGQIIDQSMGRDIAIGGRIRQAKRSTFYMNAGSLTKFKDIILRGVEDKTDEWLNMREFALAMSISMVRAKKLYKAANDQISKSGNSTTCLTFNDQMIEFSRRSFINEKGRRDEALCAKLAASSAVAFLVRSYRRPDPPKPQAPEA
jgi:hypothetical protein